MFDVWQVGSYKGNRRKFAKKIAKEKSNRRLLSAENLVCLNKIFIDNNWEKDMSNSTSCFNRFRRTLSGLTSAEQELILSLTTRFRHFSIPSYLELMLPLLKAIRRDYPKDYIYFVRCIKEEDVGKIKSCEAVLYQLRGTTVLQKMKLGGYTTVDDLRNIDVDKIKEGKAIIVLVDDYVGTGGTARGAVDYLIKQIPELAQCTKDRLCLLTLAAYKGGVEAVRSLGYNVYTSVVQDKGISDYYKGDDLLKNTQMMHGIERKLVGLSSKFRFGYGRVEGLICMERCPNNTFPIYWFKEGDAPYERGYH